MYRYEKMVDVSTHQKQIDWKKVKASGINNVMIRLGFRGYGSGVVTLDKWFIDNIRQAIAYGLNIGVYFFSTAKNDTEVLEECEFCEKTLKDIGFWDYVNLEFVYDFEGYNNTEYRTYGISKRQRTDNCLTWNDFFTSRGKKVMLYGSQNNIATTYFLNEFTDCPIWCAKYVGGYKKIVDDLQYYPVIKGEPVATNNIIAWQYTSIGNVDGINGDVDISLRKVPIEKEEVVEDMTDEIRAYQLLKELKELLEK